MSKVMIVRKDKRIRHRLLHALAFAATGGASGVVTAAEAASHASYNARTRKLESEAGPRSLRAGTLPAPSPRLRGAGNPAPWGADYDPAAEFRRQHGGKSRG